MLYEVITDLQQFLPRVPVQNPLQRIDEIKQANVVEQLIVGFRILDRRGRPAVDFTPQTFLRVQLACCLRITSYNVCYTKLLRLQRPHEAGHGRPCRHSDT